MSSRKLQQEFEKLQKKVTEGLAQFDQTHEKIYATDNSSLKEKLEGELRKEIKKLQRSRDQVKQWSSDSSNKLDRGQLQDIRGLIENAMERFKEVEKVLKMKQFSNEGLEMQTKLGARGLDEAKKLEALKYVTEVLDELNRQNELLLAEMDQYSHKKKLAAIQASIDELTEKIDRNNAHVAKLELVLRNLENDRLEPSKIDDIRDDLDYYLENNQSDDFVEYDDFYDILELDDSLDVVNQFPAAPAEPTSSTPSPKKAPSTAPFTPLEKHTTAVPTSAPVPLSIRTTSSANARSMSPAHVTTPNLASAPPHSAPSGLSSKAPPPGLSPVTSKPTTPLSGNRLTVAEELKKKALTQAAAASGLPSLNSTGSAAAALAATAGGAGASLSSELASLAPATSLSATLARSISNDIPMLAAISSPASAAASVVAHVAAASANSNALPSPLPALSQDGKVYDLICRPNSVIDFRLKNPQPFLAILHQLEASLVNCPDSFDLEVPRQYNPINVHPSSIDYPQEPMYELNSAAIMKKFDTHTLFFCFYYNEGVDNLSKYNAAKELSSRGWIFNAETKQWFSKDDTNRPRKASAVDVSNGEGSSYKYFDYQSSWLVRRKENFELKPEVQQTF